MKVLVVFGTRPEAIKCFPVVKALQAREGVEVVTCTTAQHRHILDQVLTITGLEVDIDLQLMRAKPSLTDITVDVLEQLGKVMDEVRPDRLLVQGDTTTTMAAAIAAFYRKIPVGHIEAGLRTNSILSPFPEEANRRMVSVIADQHFAPTEVTRANLLRENVPDDRIYVTGNTVIDALHTIKRRLDNGEIDHLVPPDAVRNVLAGERRVILLTAHRRENWGYGISQICKVAKTLADRGDVQIVYPVHPNPNVREPVYDALGKQANVVLMEPLDYASFIAVLDRCTLVLTDSGGVQEEAPALGKPVLVLRDTTERPEGIDAGAARLVGLDADTVLGHATELLDDAQAYRAMSEVRIPFGDGFAAERIVDAIAEANEGDNGERPAMSMA